MCPVFAIVIDGERSDADQKDDEGVAEELKERFKPVRSSKSIGRLSNKPF